METKMKIIEEPSPNSLSVSFHDTVSCDARADLEQVSPTIQCAGIYRIRNLTNNKSYIGSSINIEKRWKEHRRHLKSNVHRNPHLQHAFNTYGEASFEFTILKYCAPIKTLLLSLEQETLNNYWDGCKNCYNVCPTAGSNLGHRWTEQQKKALRESVKYSARCKQGSDHPFFGKHHSAEARAKISANCKGMLGQQHKEETKKKQSNAHLAEKNPMYGKIGELNPNYGKKHSEEQNKKQSIANSGENSATAKLTWKEVNDIRALNLTLFSISHKTLADWYGVSKATIHHILTMRSWIEFPQD